MRLRESRPVPILITWASLLLCLGIVTTGWLIGRPLTPELLGMLALISGWAVRVEVVWQQRLTDHSRAISAITLRQDVSATRAEHMYALVERQIEAERRPRSLPPGGRSR